MLFDLLVIAVVLSSAAVGAWKGLAWQLAAVFSPVAGLALGWPLSDNLAPCLGLAAPLDRFVAMGLLYVLISLAVHLLALGLRKFLERKGLRAWDHHLGFWTGMLKGFVLAVIVTCAALAFAPELRQPVHHTTSGRLMCRTLAVLRPVWPAGIGEIIRPYLTPLEKPPLPQSVALLR